MNKYFWLHMVLNQCFKAIDILFTGVKIKTGDELHQFDLVLKFDVVSHVRAKLHHAFNEKVLFVDAKHG